MCHILNGLLFMEISASLIKLRLFGKHNEMSEKKATFSVWDETVGTWRDFHLGSR